MTVWEQERALARATVGWGLGSMAAGLVLGATLRRNPWWRAFGLQHAGWGAVDLLVAMLAGRLQDRRMQRHPDPYAPPALEVERAKLFRVLWANVLADAGYLSLGIALARHRRHRRQRVAGTGTAVAIQGAFLLLHDAYYTWRTRPGHDGTGYRAARGG